MKNSKVLLNVFPSVIATLIVNFHSVAAVAQNAAAPTITADNQGLTPPYDPYPPGILPVDLNSEVARVQRQVDFIFNEAISEWQTLPPPNVQGNPPRTAAVSKSNSMRCGNV